MTANLPPRRVLAGVDIGGTKVAAMVVDEDGHTLARVARAMTSTDGTARIRPIISAVKASLKAAGVSSASLLAIGVGVPGRVDIDTGVVRLATNLDWRDVPLGSLLESTFGVPCRIENDVRLAAAGFLGHEVAGGARSLAYVAVGTGIGAGLVLDGQLHRGFRGMAGEIGHMIVEPDGVTCSCGQHGCLETVASGPAIARRATEALAAGSESSLRGARVVDAKAVYEAARAGDALALSITNSAGRQLARALAALVMTCDLERVLLGGGVAGAGQVFIRPIEAELDHLRSESPLVAELVPASTVRLLPPHFDAVVWGGVALARRTALVTAGLRVPPALTPTRTEEDLGIAEEVVAREAPS